MELIDMMSWLAVTSFFSTGPFPSGLLASILNNVVNDGLYSGIQIDESLNLSCLFYVDDVIFVVRLLGIGISMMWWPSAAKLLVVQLSNLFTILELKLASKGIDLLSLVKRKVGNGEATSFWNDVWLDDFPLKQTYLRLNFLELDKQVSVASKLRVNSLLFLFRGLTSSGNEEEQLLLLISNNYYVILLILGNRWFGF
ncbi:hypothetical protein Tco_0725226 [Tanacetum coccineum]|uniref:RNA-directed DNA polymerase, eukaryota, reverse transcriptase zinc-binding domain protein n=1 Tax=Tanacetum coccineum TaxID=301880 RepID=A0ABQ4YCA8_9ASTR